MSFQLIALVSRDRATASRWLGGILVAAAVLHAVVLAAPRFKSTWSAPSAAGTSFAGKKVAALVISEDENLRVSAEEALVRELGAVGVTNAVAAYRVVPKELLKDANAARPWFERGGFDGVITLRLVSAETERTYTPAFWGAPNYGTLWGYYGYGWTAVYQPASMRQDTVVVVENLIFSVPKNALLWAGVSETTNPKDAATVIKDLVKETMKEMRKQKLIR